MVGSGGGDELLKINVKVSFSGVEVSFHYIKLVIPATGAEDEGNGGREKCRDGFEVVMELHLMEQKQWKCGVL
ncbi:hypothetical protein BHE74_00032589 [Ensete ventricosum]|nr:hypothetical protein BHE74_00032589 [Ensete ventricosum]RZR84273.1 hypothetical protein BHM03_00011057 [Ensete ventricosum]